MYEPLCIGTDQKQRCILKYFDVVNNSHDCKYKHGIFIISYLVIPRLNPVLREDGTVPYYEYM